MDDWLAVGGSAWRGAWRDKAAFLRILPVAGPESAEEPAAQAGEDWGAFPSRAGYRSLGRSRRRGPAEAGR